MESTKIDQQYQKIVKRSQKLTKNIGKTDGQRL